MITFTLISIYRVDHLYAFFVQWTPEIYGDEEEITPEKRGFVVINDDDSEDLEMLDEHFGPNSSFQKDWEVLLLHIHVYFSCMMWSCFEFDSLGYI